MTNIQLHFRTTLMNIVTPYVTSSYVLLHPATWWHAYSIAFILCSVTFMNASDWPKFLSNQTHLAKVLPKLTLTRPTIVKCSTAWHNVEQHSPTCSTTWQVDVHCTFSIRTLLKRGINVDIRNVAQHPFLTITHLFTIIKRNYLRNY